MYECVEVDVGWKSLGPEAGERGGGEESLDWSNPFFRSEDSAPVSWLFAAGGPGQFQVNRGPKLKSDLIRMPGLGVRPMLRLAGQRASIAPD